MVGGCGFWPLLPLVILVASGGRCCRRRAESTRLNRHAESNRVAAATRFGLQEIRDDLQIVEPLNFKSDDTSCLCVPVLPLRELGQVQGQFCCPLRRCRTTWLGRGCPLDQFCNFTTINNASFFFCQVQESHRLFFNLCNFSIYSPSNAMDVVLDIVRQIVVDNVVHANDV